MSGHVLECSIRWTFAHSRCQAVRSFIGGIVYGPHERLSMLQYVEAMPQGYPLRQYPDLCHAIYCQFEVPNWSPALAYTHGREVIFPMPRLFENVWRVHSNASFQPVSIGFGAYSEGGARIPLLGRCLCRLHA